MGDFNINLLNVDTHQQTQQFIEDMYSNAFFPLITKPTRVDANTATLIDNIFCNEIHFKHPMVRILYTDISDHFPVFSVLDCNVTPVKDTTPLVRNITNEKINQFTLSLEEIDWASVYAHETCQEAYTVFHATFSALYNEHFPLQNKQSKYKARKSWLSDELKHHIKTKNKLFKKYKRNRTFTNEQIYKKTSLFPKTINSYS
ncbi:hypothetical protein CAPTEDRAFT_212442 [Capitella teleta]|uniref:Endonuclease/exonuclease/phosphatase domain-containing protein n=1 Tax=Capitella teleta TaxID=283909 RepID=R7U811_CAPTE|nr:hypothetical protein CAPTEDRAFT_212442 [Capitella teleta]|eukprot:ELT99260.1 hypothetical protein CAPTEDRAFT_212442 [Capitella teleta]